MITELRAKSQITIPKSIVDSLNLNQGDKLEVSEQDGCIKIIPISVYPKKYLDSLQKEIDQIKSDIKSGKQPVFDDIDTMLSTLK